MRHIRDIRGGRTTIPNNTNVDLAHLLRGAQAIQADAVGQRARGEQAELERDVEADVLRRGLRQPGELEVGRGGRRVGRGGLRGGDEAQVVHCEVAEGAADEETLCAVGAADAADAGRGEGAAGPVGAAGVPEDDGAVVLAADEDVVV